jgi:hypothetical protein
MPNPRARLGDISAVHGVHPSTTPVHSDTNTHPSRTYRGRRQRLLARTEQRGQRAMHLAHARHEPGLFPRALVGVANPAPSPCSVPRRRAPSRRRPSEPWRSGARWSRRRCRGVAHQPTWSTSSDFTAPGEGRDQLRGPPGGAWLSVYDFDGTPKLFGESLNGLSIPLLVEGDYLFKIAVQAGLPDPPLTISIFELPSGPLHPGGHLRANRAAGPGTRRHLAVGLRPGRAWRGRVETPARPVSNVAGAEPLSAPDVLSGHACVYNSRRRARPTTWSAVRSASAWSRRRLGRRARWRRR